MTTSIRLIHNHSLLASNTFGISATARNFISLQSVAQLQAIASDPQLSEMPRYILGGGSNVILPDVIEGLVIQIGLKGKHLVSEDEQHWFVMAEAGENWHEFVTWCLQQGYPGLENLSLIPGTVGAAPIQNIGAYGVEMQDYFDHVLAFDFLTGQTVKLEKSQCQFGYRDSIFKQAYQNRMLILSVCFALPKEWQPRLNYADVAQQLSLQKISQHDCSDSLVATPMQISEAIIAIRRRKLPDPNIIGNAGSFFKNPTVSAELRTDLIAEYPALVSYALPDGRYKLAAGWLIEHTGWKGKSIGTVGVYPQQALVLVNQGNATADAVQSLASQIQADVQHKFGVALEIEPVFF